MNSIFTGTATALVTPMRDDLSVDYDAFGRLIDFQIASGVNALVAVGTTGESATLEYAEQAEVIRFAVERAAGRVPVIAGAGTNNTLHVLENVRNACEAGADALLTLRAPRAARPAVSFDFLQQLGKSQFHRAGYRKFTVLQTLQTAGHLEENAQGQVGVRRDRRPVEPAAGRIAWVARVLRDEHEVYASVFRGVGWVA